VEKKAVVIDDKIEIRPIINIIYTFDHRYGDAAVGVRMLRVIKDYFEDPENFDYNKYPDNLPYYMMDQNKDKNQ
jgi:2-oxoglutarate dehydrogenase E2 component (dihydrolipoamide succinyltransferase)